MTGARYQRRPARVDEALVGVYLAGTQTRRRKGARAPLLRGGPLSKVAISRLVGRRSRDFGDENIRSVFLDGWFPKVWIGGRRERVPVFVTLDVRGDGERVVLDLRLAGDESAASWGEVLTGLVARHMDGNPGLLVALQIQWSGVVVPRCPAHNLRNLQAKAPARLREELTEEYRRMIYAEPVTAVEQTRTTFTKTWQLRSPAVVESLKEAGDELFTLRFPPSQRKARRTTKRARADQRSVPAAHEDAGQSAWPGPCYSCCVGCCEAGGSRCARSSATRVAHEERQ